MQLAAMALVALLGLAACDDGAGESAVGSIEVQSCGTNPEIKTYDRVYVTKADGKVALTDVPAGSVYLLGDDRRAAADSRMLGPVAIDRVRYRATGRVDRAPNRFCP